MSKVLSFLIAGFITSLLASASTEPAIIYDLTDMDTTNFQGDVIVLSGLDKYAWGAELGYLNAKGFADKNKKFNGVMGIHFVPVQEDGSYCKINKTCSWEEQTVTIGTEGDDYYIYLPAGNSYNTYLYFYVADDGSTYWAKSGHTEGQNSHIDLSFEEATVNEHLARAAPKPHRLNNINISDEDIDKPAQPEQDIQTKNINMNYYAGIVGFCIALAVGYIWLKKKN